MAQNGNGKMRGVVKWFNATKGYGFIQPSDGSKDIFVHHTGIDMDGYRELQADQTVEFEVVDGQKGLMAVDVRVVG